MGSRILLSRNYKSSLHSCVIGDYNIQFLHWLLRALLMEMLLDMLCSDPGRRVYGGNHARKFGVAGCITYR